MRGSDYLTALIFGFLPTIALCYGFEYFTDDKSSSFWLALKIIYGIQFFLWLLSIFSSTVYWRYFGGRQVQEEHWRKVFAEMKLPRRYLQNDNFDTYLYRLCDLDNTRDDKEITVKNRMDAARLQAIWERENEGFLWTLRNRSAMEKAFDQFVPKWEARFKDIDEVFGSEPDEENVEWEAT